MIVDIDVTTVHDGNPGHDGMMASITVIDENARMLTMTVAGGCAAGAYASAVPCRNTRPIRACPRGLPFCGNVK